MENKFCQSCSIPIENEEVIGTNKDGSKNDDYCIYCFKDGEFTDGIKTLDEYIEYSLQFAKEAGMTEEQIRKHCKEVLPTLKIWKCTCTDECVSGYNPNCTCTSSECHCTEKK